MELDDLIQEIIPRKNPYRVPGFSFGYRGEDEEKIVDIPGPGAYTPLLPKISKDGIKFTQSPRFDDPAKKTIAPGPGAYLTEHSSLNHSIDLSRNSSLISPKSHGTFSKAKRLALFCSTDPDLGPGQYNVKREFEALQLQRKVSNSDKKPGEKTASHSDQFMKFFALKDTPGPGQYDVSKAVTSNHKKAPGVPVSTSPRDFKHIKQMSEHGMHGDVFRYNKADMIGKEGPKYSFGSGKRSELSPPTVGPSPTSYFSHLIDAKEKDRGKVTFGQAPRKVGETSHKVELGPGPGEYDIDSGTFKKGPKMGSSPKEKEVKKKDLPPGPGYYDIIDEFQEKRREIEKKLLLQTSKMAMKSPKNNKGDNSPDYTKSSDISQQLSNTLGNNDSSPRDKSPKKLNPTKSMWVEEIIKKSVSPGPMYLIQAHNIEANLGSTGAKFTNENRPDFVIDEIKKDVPGPGKYFSPVAQGDESPKVKFPKSRRKDNPVLQEYTVSIPGPDKYMLELASRSIVGGGFGRAGRRLVEGEEAVTSSPKKKKQQPQQNVSVAETLDLSKSKLTKGEGNNK